MSNRIVVAGRQLAVVIALWLRATPERLWGKDPHFEKLKTLRQQDGQAPDPRQEVADYLVKRMEEIDWEVSYPDKGPPASPPPWSGNREAS